MHPLSLTDKLLRASERLLPVTVLCCDLAIWLLFVPNQFLTRL